MPLDPKEDEWLLLKIIAVDEELVKRKLVIDEKIVEKEVPTLHLVLRPLSLRYAKSGPYHVWVTKGNPIMAYENTKHRQRNAGMGYQDFREKNLRSAADVPDDQILGPATLLEKHVMGRCLYKLSRSGKFPTVHPDFAHPNGVLVSVNMGGSVVEGRASLESARFCLNPRPGTKARVILSDDRQITVVRFENEWRRTTEN
ncbi:hypothetical protein [Rhodococcus qingshengii]|uniref:hypothetical protein n=1 Tax=Rhodococcus qingshengii TaxID=334542 RepID=UPI0035E07E41